MRRSLVAALIALVLLTVPVQAQVSEDALAPFVGKFTDAAGGGRFNVYITTGSGLIATWYFGSGCMVSAFPCDPASGSIGNIPGGHATAALWRIEGGELIGDVLSTEQASVMSPGPIRVILLGDGKLGLRQGDNIRVLDRVR